MKGYHDKIFHVTEDKVFHTAVKADTAKSASKSATDVGHSQPRELSHILSTPTNLTPCGNVQAAELK